MTAPGIGARHYGETHQWTNDDDMVAVQMRSAGFSASEIAKKLSYPNTNFWISRFAVIGRLSRLKFKDPLSKKERAIKSAKERKLKPKSEIHDRQISISKCFSQMPVMDDSRSFTISLSDARECDCRYPVGDARKLRICGQPVESGSSYCSEHILRCFASVKPIPVVSRGVVG